MPPLPEPAMGAIAFQYLAEVAVGATARVDLCLTMGGPRDGKLLAVKRLHPHIAEDPGFAAEFFDEVWMTAALKHPNVVEVQGWGTDSQGSYLAVELVQGVSLSRLMKTVFDTGEVFGERMVVYVISRLCRGLAAAHRLCGSDGELLHLVHRDLTPGNVLIGFNGDVKITDFGLAKAKQRLTKTLTGLLKGQPTYMAPEQARAHEIDSRADLFSLGVMMFELFAGRRPWVASSDFEMVQLTAKEPPADLRELRPKIDRELVAVVMRCLEKDPNARFQSAEEIGARLESWLEVHGYSDGNEEALARFVRRNAMRQMRWFERAVAGELAPLSGPDGRLTEGMRTGGGGASGRPKPPRASSYTNVPASRAPASSESTPKRPRSKRPPPFPRAEADAETTDVTDAESKIAALQQAVPPVIREAPRPPAKIKGGDTTTQDDVDWGEEVPTVVQKNQGGGVRPGMPAARGRPAPPPRAEAFAPTRPLPIPDISDDDSENRTTAVKRPGNEAAYAAAARAAKAARQGIGPIADMDSEEMPTVPVKNAPQPGMAPPRGVRPVAHSVPSISGVPRGESPLDPQRPTSRSSATVAAVKPGTVVAPSEGVPPPPIPSRPPIPAPPPLPPVPSGNDGSIPVSPAAAEDLSDPRGTPFGTPMNGASRASERHESTVPTAPTSSPQSVRPIASPLRDLSQLTEELLLQEADRLAIEAVRRNEEAKSAAARAERKATMARMASDAALIAAEAVRLAAIAGLQAAALRLEEARALEQALQRGAFGDKGGDTTGAQRISAAPSPQTVMSSQAGVQVVPGFYQFDPTASPRPSQPAPSALTSSDMNAPLDPASFRSRLKPALFGMPGLVVAALAAGAFGVMLLILWLLFG